MKKIVYKFYKNNCPGCYAMSKAMLSIEKETEEFEFLEKNIEIEENKLFAKSFGLNIVPALVRSWDKKVLTGGKNKSKDILDFLKGE